MPEQIDLVLLAGAEPPRHGLRGDVFAIDAMDDAVDLEGREHPVDGRARRLDGVAPAAKIAGDAPADLEARPARRKPRPDPSDKFASALFLDHEHAEAMQRPMP